MISHFFKIFFEKKRLNLKRIFKQKLKHKSIEIKKILKKKKIGERKI
jgi:hypothetical protein